MGRDIGADYRLEDYGISRFHLEFIRLSHTYSVRDLGSTNGSYLNGDRMTAYQLYPVDHGDVIDLPNIRMVYQNEGRSKVPAFPSVEQQMKVS